MSQIKLTLDKRRVKTNGTYPLAFRITAKEIPETLKQSIHLKKLIGMIKVPKLNHLTA
jgi:hypothetical protein